MRRTKSSCLKQKRANKHLRGLKNYTLSNEQKSFDYVSTSDMLFATNKKYRIFSILGGISASVLSVLVPINLFFAFIAYVATEIFNLLSSRILGVGNASFMSVIKILYLNNEEFMRDIFVTICVAIIVFFLSLYGMWATEKKTDITSLTNQYYGKIRREK